MRRNVLTFACILLGSPACMFQSPGEGEEVLVFSSTLRYLRAHPVHGGRPQCFEEQMLTRAARRASLQKADDVHGFIRDDFRQVMNRCSDQRVMSPVEETRYQFYQPEINEDRATIQVDSHCGSLCGKGMTYMLVRNAADPGWNVTSSRMIWIS